MLFDRFEDASLALYCQTSELFIVFNIVHVVFKFPLAELKLFLYVLQSW